jgi:hypothetical protein
MSKTLSESECQKARESIMVYVREVVPYALIITVISGLYLIYHIFGKVDSSGLTNFQILLSIKAVLGLWLGIRGFNQKVFGINPLIFKSHILPFYLLIIIIIISQIIYF